MSESSCPGPFPRDGVTAPGPLRRPRLPLAVVAKPTGAACNLDCQYCFFLSKELLYDSRRQLMSEETLETYVAEYLAASGDGEVTMVWQGGEPTMRGLPFYERAVSLCETYRRPSQHVVHAMQTNATLITPQWAQFLARHDFLVGVSIDGPAHLHDAYRVNRAGRPTYSMVRRGWDVLQDAGVRCNVLCTVHHANEHHPLEVYRHLREDLGAHYIQFIPIVERVEAKDLKSAEAGWRGRGGTRLLYRQHGGAVTSRSTDPLAYGRFLTEVFHEWVANESGRCSSRTSTLPWRRCSANTRCVCMPPSAGSTWPWSSTGTSTRVTTGLSRSGGWATSRAPPSSPWRRVR